MTQPTPTAAHRAEASVGKTSASKEVDTAHAATRSCEVQKALVSDLGAVGQGEPAEVGAAIGQLLKAAISSLFEERLRLGLVREDVH